MSKALAMSEVRPLLEGANLGVPIKWPNEYFQQPEPPALYIAVEISSGHDRPLEIGGSNVTWEAMGQVWCHVMTPTDAGYDEVFALQDNLSYLFRDTGATQSIVFDQIRDDPGDYGGQNGNYWRSSVTVDWRVQTRRLAP